MRGEGGGGRGEGQEGTGGGRREEGEQEGGGEVRYSTDLA